MIYLIGGSSHVGKTFLAQKLMEKTNIPYTSLDHLKMGFIRTGRTNLTPEDDYEMRYFLWPFAAEMVKTAIENKQSMILEGCYIPGEWKDSFEPEYLKEIKCVFIVMSEEYIEKNFDKLKDYADVIEQRGEEELDKDRLINCSKEFEKDCIKYDIHVIKIEDEFDIEEMLNRVLNL